MLAMTNIYEKYADLLCDYCLYLKKGERLLVRSTPLAEPLLQALHAALMTRGIIVEYMLGFKDKAKLTYNNAQDNVLETPSPFYDFATKHFDAFLTIDAPYDVHETKDVDADKKTKAQLAVKDIRENFFQRSADGNVKWALCVFPTDSAAKNCGMSLDEYQTFVYEACFLTSPNPTNEWLAISKKQQVAVDRLNKADMICYKGPNIDISFSTKGRTWINSDGKRNMPSGEVFSSPVESSVNGSIHFTCPTTYDGQDVEAITLAVKDGVITHWKAEVGQAVLDRVFAIEGARQFGEVAIGTNEQIQRITKNILFDEKIAGTVHMAVGASYPEAGGLNKSVVHWDMITDMTKGEITADGEIIYQNGQFCL